jgi:hypothetical protein
VPWGVVHAIVGVALGGIALWALNGRRGELVGASSELGRLHVEWLFFAIAAEIVSFIAFGAVQLRLLLTGKVRIGLSDATAISLAAGAIADSLPAGPAFASVYAFRIYRRRGADDVVASWTLVGTFVAEMLTLVLIAAVGVVLAAREGASYDLIGVIAFLVLASVLVGYLVLQRTVLARLVELVLRATRRLVHRPRRDPAAIVADVLIRMRAVELRPADIVAILIASAANWLFDCGALTFSFLCVGAPIPWRALLLTYGAAQLAANLPITPGGLGIVEGTLTVALVAFGGAEQSTVAAVLCYRIVSFWGYLPVGWLSWCGMALWNRRLDKRAAARQGIARVLAAVEDGSATIVSPSPSNTMGAEG